MVAELERLAAENATLRAIGRAALDSIEDLKAENATLAERLRQLEDACLLSIGNCSCVNGCRNCDRLAACLKGEAKGGG